VVDSQTLWDQLHAVARHLEPTYAALERRALEAPVINVDETRWAIMGKAQPAAGTVWGVHAPTVSVYRIVPGKSADEGRQVLGGYTGIVVADGFAVYEVLARDGPGFTLAHCWAHTKRKYDDIATTWPTACADINALIGELYAIERCVPGPFPGDAAAQELRQQWRTDRSQPVLDRIWTWATQQVGLPRSDFGKAVRYMLERWAGLTRFVANPRIPLDNNAERALRGPVVGRKNHYGSRSLRGTQVAALFYTLCENRQAARRRSARVSTACAVRRHRNARRHHLSRGSPHVPAGVDSPADRSAERNCVGHPTTGCGEVLRIMPEW
jgi:transposase